VYVDDKKIDAVKSQLGHLRIGLDDKKHPEEILSQGLRLDLVGCVS
jgi:hypothetical protein